MKNNNHEMRKCTKMPGGGVLLGAIFKEYRHSNRYIGSDSDISSIP
jgi:hypothetical protein